MVYNIYIPSMYSLCCKISTGVYKPPDFFHSQIRPYSLNFSTDPLGKLFR